MCLQVHDSYIAISREDPAVGRLQGRAGEDSVLSSLIVFIDEFVQFLQPRAAIFL